MTSPPQERRAVRRLPVLEQPLEAVEQRLFDLGQALHRRDAAAVDRIAAELHQALAAAVSHFAQAAQVGAVPPGLRHRLALAGGQVAAQREALARATASLDRAIEVLIPRLGRTQPGGLYDAGGHAMRRGGSGGGAGYVA